MRLLLLIPCVTAPIWAHAQDNCPDIPKYHWVYEAAYALRRDGFFEHRPDAGPLATYSGRPATWYEMGSAITDMFREYDAQLNAALQKGPLVKGSDDWKRFDGCYPKLHELLKFPKGLDHEGSTYIGPIWQERSLPRC